MAQIEQRQREEADERSILESVDDPMVCRMRLILALSALLIIYIDPSEPDRHVEITYGALVLYSLYSAVLYYLAVYRRGWLPTKIDHWIDVGWYVLFIALSSGTSSIFFFFFFFAVLISSFHWGFKTGVRVTLVSTLLFTVVGYATAPAAPYFELNRFLLRPIYLLVLGYMMAYWGGSEIMLKRRLMLLKGIVKLSNPRFGVQHTIGSVIKKLRDFYDADACLLIMAERNGSEDHLYRVERDHTEGSVQGEPIPAELARLLLVLPETIAARYCGKRLSWPLQGARYNAFDLMKREHTSVGEESSAVLADTFEADAFITAPLSYRGRYEGRLYLTASRRAFENSDLEFIAQVIEQVMPVLDNIRLLDRLASNAAEQERQRLARDIHDSVIQPYIGLQYRLAAIRNKLQVNGGNDVADDIERLFQITVDEISDLRGFVRGLKSADLRTDDFLSAVRRFAKQFTDHFDIDVKIESSSAININDRLAAEVIQMIYEGLSNIRKHTRAASSTIYLSCNETTLFLSIENDGDAVASGGEAASFTPGSITGRAEALGGHARVERTPQGHTSVKIEIPL